MATVTGLTKERMLSIEAASVVSGAIDAYGHLILTKHDGSTIDAGYALVAVPDATTTVKGVAELATQAEVEAHSDSTRAVTPASLASSLARVTTLEGEFSGLSPHLTPASYSQTSVLTTYPMGLSYLYMSNTETTTGGWDFAGQYGLVTTYRYSADFAMQTWIQHATGAGGVPVVWTRTANSPSSWSRWAKHATSLDPSTVGMVGEVKMWPTATIPTSWLLCDGSAVSRATYSDLFNILGTTYGAGDGTTTFNLPNMKGRVPVGVDSTQTEFTSTGQTGGEKTHVLTTTEMPSHTHTQDAHTHTLPNHGALTDGSGSPSYTTPNSPVVYGFGTNQIPSVAATNQNTGGGAAHNNLQPYITVRYIIKS